MSKLAFIGRFLALFALLILLGWFARAPARYAGALHATANVIAPATSGWWLETRSDQGGTGQLWLRRGEQEMRMLLSLEALALSLLPFLALLGATPGLGWRQLLIRAAIGCAGLFALDLLVLLLYPVLVPSPTAAPTTTARVAEALTDISGTFLGLLTFVGGPVILWFALTFDRLRGVWGLGDKRR